MVLRLNARRSFSRSTCFPVKFSGTDSHLVQIPIDGVLGLHTFCLNDVKILGSDYICMYLYEGRLQGD